MASLLLLLLAASRLTGLASLALDAPVFGLADDFEATLLALLFFGTALIVNRTLQFGCLLS